MSVCGRAAHDGRIDAMHAMDLEWSYCEQQVLETYMSLRFRVVRFFRMPSAMATVVPLRMLLRTGSLGSQLRDAERCML